MRWASEQKLLAEQELLGGHGIAPPAMKDVRMPEPGAPGPTPAEVLREMGTTVSGFLAFALTTHLLLILLGL
jgi:hypothetical protein